MDLQLTQFREPGWRSSPAATLFRADFRRLWSDRTLRTSIKALGAIFVLQFVVGLLFERMLPISSRSSWNPAYALASALGLNAGWTTALLRSFNQLAPGVTFRSGFYPTWLTVALGLMSVPLQMLVPAFAAQSIAPDRENGRLEELLLAGFTPRQLFVAKGLAALGPFLLLWLLLTVVSAGVQAHLVTHYPEMPGQTGPTPSVLWWSFTFQLVHRLTILLLFAVMVCISALCNRFRHALVSCYGVAFLWPVLTQAAQAAWPRSPGNPYGAHLHYLSLGEFVLAAVVLGVLLPKVLQAIAETDRAPKPARRPMRIMECGAEEPGE